MEHAPGAHREKIRRTRLGEFMIFLIPRWKVFWQTACYVVAVFDVAGVVAAAVVAIAVDVAVVYKLITTLRIQNAEKLRKTHGGHFRCASQMTKTCEKCMGAISVLRKSRGNAWGQFRFLGGNIVGAISAW